MVFVYQTTSAVGLARALSTELGSLTGEAGAVAYHAKISKAIREKSRDAYLAGRSRCLVCTSALAAGASLPATHVIIRDLTFPGVGPLSVEDLIQMSGRAARGTRTGHAYFIHRASDGWNLDELTANLALPGLRRLGSALVPAIGQQTMAKPRSGDTAIPATATMMLSLLARAGETGRTLPEIESFVGKTLAGKLIVPQVRQALDWLRAPHRLFAFEDKDGHWVPTSLGWATARSTLPLSFAAAFGQLTRDLFSLEIEEQAFGEWSSLDHLLVVELLSQRAFSLRQFSESLREQVDNWIERSSEKSVLYREWIRGAKEHSKAAELLGSLQLHAERGFTDPDEWSRRKAYLSILRTTILWERSERSDRRGNLTAMERSIL